MRYYIIFGITIILALIIMFYRPFLYEYSNSVTIEYNFEDVEGYEWEYETNNNKLSLVNHNNKKWEFKPNKNGKTKIVYYYKNKDDYKYKINYEFYVLGNMIFWLDGKAEGLLSFPNPY